MLANLDFIGVAESVQFDRQPWVDNWNKLHRALEISIPNF
jgi:hypothetical protein